MTTGELARRGGVNLQTVRYYERRKLLRAPHRWSDSGHRDFDDEALAQLRFIRAAKAAGFTLEEIKNLLELTVLPQEACGDVSALFMRKISDLDRQMREIRRKRRTLVRLLKHCSKQRRGSRECLALSAFWPNPKPDEQ
ncbi:MAG: MerR family transcriptional regulator [Opitutaceae bacterium]